MAGYTPEEIAALRSKLAGSSDVGAFDKKAADVSASASRLADHPLVSGILSGGGLTPATPMLRDAIGQASLSSGGGVGDLSKKTQGTLADQVTSPGGTILRPLDNGTPDVTPAPSLREQLMSKLQGNTGGGANSGIGGLRAAYLASRRRQIGDFEADKELAGEQGINKSVHVDELAALQNAHAAKVQRDAEIDMQAQEKAHEQHQALINQNLKVADDIGRQQVDPKRLAHSMGGGETFMHILGGALGGALAARTGGPNQFLDRFDRQVSEDIQSQLNAIDNKKVSLGARQTALGQMIQATGDRRLGVQMYRNAMYEAAKQHLTAEDARLSVPEIRTNAQQNVQAIQHQQDGMQTQFDAEAYQTAQQAAAAQAAAQRAAENAAWQRQKDVFEMGLKKDTLDIERIKAGKEAGKEDNAAIAETTKRLGDDDVVKNRDLINSLNRKIDKDGNVVGLGMDAKLRSSAVQSLLGPAGVLLPNVGDRVGMSDEERIANQEFKQAALLYQTKVTGSGGSDPQMQKIGEAFKGAGTMAEKRRAIGMLKNELDRREGVAMSNLSDSQKVELQRRLAREGQTDLPGSTKVTAGNVSDERAKNIKKKLGGY